MTKGKIFVFSLVLATEALLVEAKDTLDLPSPRYHGKTSVEQALNSRKTVRQFKEEAIELEELSQLIIYVHSIYFRAFSCISAHSVHRVKTKYRLFIDC